MSVITITRGLSTWGSTRAAIAAHRSAASAACFAVVAACCSRVGGAGGGGSAGPQAISPAANATAVAHAAIEGHAPRGAECAARDEAADAARDHFAAGGSV